MSKSNQDLIGALLLSAAGFLIFYFVLQTYSAVGQLKAAVSEKQALLDSRTEIINKILGLKKDFESNKYKVEAISIPIPDKKRIPELLSTLEHVGNSTGLPIKDITITQSSQASKNSQVETIDVGGKLSGTYESFKAFLTAIENSRRLIDISSMKVSLNEETNDLAIELSGKAYFLKPLSEINKEKPKSNNLNEDAE